MATKKKSARMAGVAEGKQLSPVPTADDISAADKVKALLSGSLAEDIYDVR